MREGYAKTWAWESSYYLDGSRCQPRFPPHVECGGLAAALRVEPSHEIDEIAASRPGRAAFDFNFFTLKPLNPCTLKFSTPPPQTNRPLQRMFHSRSRPPRLDQIR